MCIHEIAAIIGTDGVSIPLNEPGNIVVYRRVRGTWQKDREMAFALSPEQGLRESAQEDGGAQRLPPRLPYRCLKVSKRCTLLRGSRRPGARSGRLRGRRPSSSIPYGARRKPSKMRKARWPMPVYRRPQRSRPGHFTISIREIQGKRPEVSSKQVLQQFVQRGGFAELEIICDHVPPWIEVEAERRGYEIVSEKTAQNEVKVILSQTSGGGC